MSESKGLVQPTVKLYATSNLLETADEVSIVAPMFQKRQLLISPTDNRICSLCLADFQFLGLCSDRRHIPSAISSIRRLY